MSYKWPIVTIDEIKADSKGSIAIGPFGSRMKSDCYVAEGIPVIRGTNITSGPSFEGSFVYVTKEKADTLGSSNVYKGDLVFPHRGSIGEVGIIEENKHYVLSSSLMKLTCDKEKANSKFLYYFFKSRLGRHELLKNASQVGTPGIGQPLTSLKSVELQLPPLDIQNKIESVLTSLDNKITKKRNINETLESISQAIFKSWFVDFNPVKAKVEALESGGNIEDAEIAAMCVISSKNKCELEEFKKRNPDEYKTLSQSAAMFPSAMQESEVGKIPIGWEVKSLDKIAHFQNGLALQKFRPAGSEYLPVLKIAQLKKGVTDNKEKASPNIKPECIVNNGDIIFSWSGSLMVETWCGGKAALNQHLFKVTSNDYPKWLYNYFTKFHLREFQHIAEAKAVTMGHIKREHLSQAKCVIPNDALIKLGDLAIGKLLNMQIAHRLEISTLSELRNTLLPRLLSGEIEVR